MFLFNYYFSEFEIETGRTLELVLSRRTSDLELQSSDSSSTGLSIATEISRRTSVLFVGQPSIEVGRSVGAQVETRKGNVLCILGYSTLDSGTSISVDLTKRVSALSLGIGEEDSNGVSAAFNILKRTSLLENQIEEDSEGNSAGSQISGRRSIATIEIY